MSGHTLPSIWLSLSFHLPLPLCLSFWLPFCLHREKQQYDEMIGFS